ncbi:MurR/RpiR family transcriptional regulator [Paracoccus sp. (in: a-proteobacteria)]|uniref:MurR/RpiR family transcriptional regulator n=1 Tax=Paracoccus sp. TaxID=267 RepID=UPI0035AEE6BF
MSDDRPDGPQGLFQLLQDREARLTPAERAAAAWLRDNIAVVPFNTGAQMAQAIGISEMTLIRFLRSLGYANLRDLKAQLRPLPATDTALLDDVAQRFTSLSSDMGALAASLERELMSVRHVYEMATTPVWDRIVTRLAETPLIHVAGFQASQGVALDFASRLKYVRPGIRAVQGSTGVFSEVLDSDPATSLLFIIDTAAYARKGVQLVRKATELGIPLVAMIDRYSHWPREFTDDVLELNTMAGTYWDSQTSLAAASNLLVHFTAGRLGPRANARFEKMAALGEHFQEFDPAASRFSEANRARARREQDG